MSDKELVQSHSVSTTSNDTTLPLRGRFPTFTSFCKAYSPDNITIVGRYKERCLFGTSPTLATLNKTYGNSSSIQLLMVHLSYVNEISFFSSRMSVQQIEYTATAIVQEFYYLKVSEIMLFLNGLMTGAYGLFYPTPVDILTLLRERFTPYRNAAYAKHEEEELQQKISDDAERFRNMTDEERKRIQEIKDRICRKLSIGTEN